MLMTASDAKFAQPQVVSRVLVGSIVGPTRAVIEAGGNRSTFESLKLHLTALCVGYLKEMSSAAASELPRSGSKPAARGMSRCRDIRRIFQRPTRSSSSDGRRHATQMSRLGVTPSALSVAPGLFELMNSRCPIRRKRDLLIGRG